MTHNTAQENRPPLLSVRDLKTVFELDEGTVIAVDGVSFDVYPSQVVGIVGESGCGKSATVKSILRLIEAPGRISSGRILFRPEPTQPEPIDLVQLDPRGKQIRAIRGAEIALIPQEPMAAFSPVHTIGNQLIEAVRLHQRISKRAARAIALERLTEVGVPHPAQCLESYSWQLSGGLRQRAMIAMALTCNPALLIADEPTTAIDVTTQAQVLNLLGRLQQQHHTAIIFITHDLGVIAQTADFVVVMYLGRVMESGPVDAIFHQPQHPYTRALLESIPSLKTARHSRLPTIAGSIPHPFNRPPGCPFAQRCPDRMPECERKLPALVPLNEQQAVSCFKYHDQIDTQSGAKHA
ncbi:MAG: ABC transporter ATP-binding protein [Candidatus Competibacteraceae bacterium]|nr:ABC transporter ATP-binding protein [Candidatus Competibacteraceae bacterium]